MRRLHLPRPREPAGGPRAGAQGAHGRWGRLLRLLGVCQEVGLGGSAFQREPGGGHGCSPRALHTAPERPGRGLLALCGACLSKFTLSVIFHSSLVFSIHSFVRLLVVSILMRT